jgi:hypothetical protein
MKRRDFLHQVVPSALSLLPLAKAQGQTFHAPKSNHFIGVQIHPFSFYDEGPERVLDLLQTSADVNALLIYSHLYAADQSIPKEVLAHDHPGFVPVEPKQRRYRKVWAQHDTKTFDGLLLKHEFNETNVEFAGKNLFAELEPLCKSRGIKLMGRILEPRAKHGMEMITNFSQALTVDIDGNPGVNACWNNPDYRQFWHVTVADTFRNNPLTGFMLGAERTGPLYRLIQAGEPPSCFCVHCQSSMEDKGISQTRLRAGYAALNEWVQSMRRDRKRPVDGALTTFLRILMRHPELLVWEREWALSLEESLGSLVKSIKSVRPDALVGRHIDHQQSTWDIFYRAAVSYGEMAESMDFLKPVVYHDIAAPRIREWMIQEFNKSILADLSQSQSLDLFYAVFGLDPAKEPALEAMLEGSFSPDYVFRETKRCVDGVDGKAHVYPGIGFDVPFHQKNAPPRAHCSNPELLSEATRKALEANANGIIICREYQEMQLPNLRAIGDALRET